MTREELKEKVRQYIRTAKTDEAIKVVTNWAYQNNDETLKDAIAQLSGQLVTLKNDMLMGLIGTTEANIRQNNVNNSILKLVISLAEPKTAVAETLKEVKKTSGKPLSVFISYSKSDKEYLDSFRKYLKPLERKGAIQIWDDTKLKAGDVWEVAIENQLNTADIIVFLVSSDLINTDYVWDVEMTTAFARHERGDVHVVPVILRDCGWLDTEFSKFNALPDKGRPVSTFRTQDDAWLLVYEKLKGLIG